jgi:hypothetical protein
MWPISRSPAILQSLQNDRDWRRETATVGVHDEAGGCVGCANAIVTERSVAGRA